MCVCLRAYVYTYIHTYIHTYIYIYTCIHIYSRIIYLRGLKGDGIFCLNMFAGYWSPAVVFETMVPLRSIHLMCVGGCGVCEHAYICMRVCDCSWNDSVIEIYPHDGCWWGLSQSVLISECD